MAFIRDHGAGAGENSSNFNTRKLRPIKDPLSSNLQKAGPNPTIFGANWPLDSCHFKLFLLRPLKGVFHTHGNILGDIGLLWSLQSNAAEALIRAIRALFHGSL